MEVRIEMSVYVSEMLCSLDQIDKRGDRVNSKEAGKTWSFRRLCASKFINLVKRSPLLSRCD